MRSFVIRAEQRCAVGDNQILAYIVIEGREACCRQDFTVCKRQIFARIADDRGADVFAADIGRGVHVRDQPDGGIGFMPGACGQKGVDITVFINACVGHTDCGKLFDEKFAEDALSRCCGRCRAVFVGGGFKGNIM